MFCQEHQLIVMFLIFFGWYWSKLFTFRCAYTIFDCTEPCVVFTNHLMMRFHFLILIASLFCAEMYQEEAEHTCWHTQWHGGGPDSSFDRGLFVQLAQQLFSRPVSGISILYHSGSAVGLGMSHLPPSDSMLRELKVRSDCYYRGQAEACWLQEKAVLFAGEHQNQH